MHLKACKDFLSRYFLIILIWASAAIFLCIYWLAYSGFVVQNIPTGVGYHFNSNTSNKKFKESLVNFLNKNTSLKLESNLDNYLRFENSNTSLTLHEGRDLDFTMFITSNNEQVKDWLRIAQQVDKHILSNTTNIKQVTLQRNPKIYRCGDLRIPCDNKLSYPVIWDKLDLVGR